MVVTVSTDDRRSVQALVLLAGSDCWQKGRTKDGRPFYAIPSRREAGLLHMTDGSDCTCADRRVRGADCAHLLAARLYRARLMAEQPKSQPNPCAICSQTHASDQERREAHAAMAADILGTDGN